MMDVVDDVLEDHGHKVATVLAVAGLAVLYVAEGYTVAGLDVTGVGVAGIAIAVPVWARSSKLQVVRSCHQCGADHYDDLRFCPGCGAQQTVEKHELCPNCDAQPVTPAAADGIAPESTANTPQEA